MDHFAGLDVSVKETSICIVDDTGKIIREVKVASEPGVLLAVLKNPAYHFKRIGYAHCALGARACMAAPSYSRRRGLVGNNDAQSSTGDAGEWNLSDDCCHRHGSECFDYRSHARRAGSG